MKNSFFLFAVVLGCFFSPLFIHAQSTTTATVTEQTAPTIPGFQQYFFDLFQAGVDISFFEHYWSNKEEISKKNVYHKIELAQKIGFKTIGIPIKIDMFLEKDQKTLSATRVRNTDKLFDYIIANNLNIILTYHFGVTRTATPDAVENEINKLIFLWGKIATHLKGKGYNNIYFGLYDEPRASDEIWEYANKKLMAALRPIDPNRYWIIGSNNYMNVRAFENLTPIPNDDKILYTFHFYAPYIFTHQGAAWDKEKAYMKGLPYPYSAEEMPPMPAKAKGTEMEYNYNNYHIKANRAYLGGLIKLAHEWSIKHQVPIICTETGTLKTIPEKYRNNYYKDVSELMKFYGIPLLVWDLDQSLGIVNSQGVPLKSITDWTQTFKK